MNERVKELWVAVYYSAYLKYACTESSDLFDALCTTTDQRQLGQHVNVGCLRREGTKCHRATWSMVTVCCRVYLSRWDAGRSQATQLMLRDERSEGEFVWLLCELMSRLEMTCQESTRKGKRKWNDTWASIKFFFCTKSRLGLGSSVLCAGATLSPVVTFTRIMPPSTEARCTYWHDSKHGTCSNRQRKIVLQMMALMTMTRRR